MLRQFCHILRQGTTDWNAECLVPEEVLKTLVHGEIYTAKQLKLQWIFTTTKNEKIGNNFQYIKEELDD